MHRTHRYRVSIFFSLLFVLGLYSTGWADTLTANVTGSIAVAAGRCVGVPTVYATGTGTSVPLGAVTFTESHCPVVGNPLAFTDGVFVLAAGADSITGTYTGSLVATADPNVFGFSNSPFTITGGTGNYVGAAGSGFTNGSYNALTHAISFQFAADFTLPKGNPKNYICWPAPMPSGYSVVGVDNSPGNICGFGGATVYIDKTRDGLTVCGLSVTTATLGYLLYPADYAPSMTTTANGCPGGTGLVINKVSGLNQVCRLSNYIGTQQVVPSGYVATGIDYLHPGVSCPGPIVTVKSPTKQENVCDPGEIDAPYLVPFGYSLTQRQTVPSCPHTGWLLEKGKTATAVFDTSGSASCGLVGSVRSITGITPTTVQFVNKSSQAVNIYWIDYSGNPIFWFTLPAKYSQDQGTYATHPWLIRGVNGSCIGVYTATASPGQVEIK